MSKKHPKRTSKTAPAQGQIRIIGGRWRGRKLPVLDAEGLRPTTDRVKETVFNWLQFELSDAAVVDLFAGSGSLGFEALSRGAAHATFVETSAAAVRQLRSNIALLEAPADVLLQDAIACIAALPQASADIVFIDPPFAQGWLDKVIPALAQAQVLRSPAWVYVESGQHDNVDNWPEGWQLYREKTAGQVTYRLFRIGGEG